MNRREFLFASAAVAATSLRGASPAAAGASVVLLSDCHVNGENTGHTAAETAKTIKAILALDPLPKTLVYFGDLAAGVGREIDYRAAKEVFRPLVDAGVTIRWMMGNHDHREPFAKVFPEAAAASPVPGRIVGTVAVGGFDLVLLDSLSEVGGDGQGNNLDGEIDEAQLKWLRDYAAAATRPYFICAHHDGRQMKKFAQTAMGMSRRMIGYLHGHRHSWMPDALHNWGETGRLVRSVGLPSGSAWGDIGFAVLTDRGDHAEIELFERDCFFPKPAETAAERPALWDDMIKENNRSRIRFAYPRALS